MSKSKIGLGTTYFLRRAENGILNLDDVDRVLDEIESEYAIATPCPSGSEINPCQISLREEANPLQALEVTDKDFTETESPLFEGRDVEVVCEKYTDTESLNDEPCYDDRKIKFICSMQYENDYELTSMLGQLWMPANTYSSSVSDGHRTPEPETSIGTGDHSTVGTKLNREDVELKQILQLQELAAFRKEIMDKMQRNISHGESIVIER